ncbi:MAG: secretin and TonB N-terminal domain-containing protein [Sedimentisphaerales bacterium]|jgi:type IV pilus assembly protein PilQ
MLTNLITKSLLLVAVLLLLPGPVVFAEISAANESDANAGSKAEVLTTLEQRMQKRISVDFRDTAIDDVIRIMAEQANVDVVKSPKVIGTVTAKLSNVPLEEALHNILASQGYDYVMSKNIIRVAPTGEISEEAEKLMTKIYRVNYADIKEVEKSLSKFVSQRGAITTNQGTSNIIVKDTESNIKAIGTFIEDIDRVTPQILVEARIYDLTSKNALDLGVEWNTGSNTQYYSGGQPVIPPGIMGETKTGQTYPFETGMFRGNTAETTGVTGQLKFGWLSNNIDIDAIISAQKNITDAKLLANPRILVLDNETATISIISEIPYQELTQTSGGGNIGSTDFKDVGVTLKVTPHLARGEKIRMKVEPEFSVKTGDVTFASGALSYPQPVVDSRKASTTLLVDSGQTVVLGGLRKKDVSKSVSKIPLLGDIPIICYLFRFEGESTTNSEMVVFITPKIVNEASMTEREKKQYEITEFRGPEPQQTRAEKDIEAGKIDN